MMLDAQDKVATRMVKIWEANLEMTKPLVKEGQLHEVAVERMKGQISLWYPQHRHGHTPANA